MIYYQDETLIIRDFSEQDAQPLTDAECTQGWHTDIAKFHQRLQDQRAGIAVCLAAEYLGETAGYVNVYPNATGGAFGGRGLPEIIDFAVLEKFRRRGIGSLLMDEAEKIAARYADTVYLGVGLHAGYGSAQRMYVKRGYLPDGSGVWYGHSPAEPYQTYCNDDDLNLYLSKKLR